MTQRILLIDDDQELCELLGTWLSAEGFTLQSVHDGEAGLETAQTLEREKEELRRRLVELKERLAEAKIDPA